jgi:DNA-binding NarL/FixJ family response regulator
MTNEPTVRVLVADPHFCVREGLKAILGAQPGMSVVGEAADGPTALALASELNPDLVVLETALPELDGAQVTARLREACPEQRVLVLTACEHAGAARLALGVGARGYALKRAPAEQLVRAVRAVAAGETYVDPELATSLVGAFLRAGEEQPAAALSDREVQVVRLIAQGYSNKEIAARLRVSVKTIETYKARSMDKLQLRSRVDIVRYAVQCGWLTGDTSELSDPAGRES